MCSKAVWAIALLVLMICTWICSLFFYYFYFLYFLYFIFIYFIFPKKSVLAWDGSDTVPTRLSDTVPTCMHMGSEVLFT